ncbi:hypothetical protein X731_16375 [Mesorhizobium sp. L2C054A000]|nr:hypothetical protein X731_16375 [Mesorhizobium sp. L2C054A000]
MRPVTATDNGKLVTGLDYQKGAIPAGRRSLPDFRFAAPIQNVTKLVTAQ